MWQNKSCFYQIYPLGFCGAPKANDGVIQDRISKIHGWIDYFVDLGVDTILFNPIFDSDNHGYDTRDLTKIDCRLGTNKDFASLSAALHKRGIRVVLDGVFNHVGRGFWAFKDVLKNRENSAYKDWFYIRFNQDNGYHDGLFYEGWEGHYELVKLNLNNPDVINYLFNCIKDWVEEFNIDGLRLDVAYCLDRNFLKALKIFCQSLKSDFFLMGEVLFGDYKQIVNPDMLSSCTNYECYKGIHSSLNSMNFFEISYSLNRQFGPDSYAIYKGLNLFNFVDNHDVSRIASILSNKEHIKLAYGLLFSMPGIPCIYYGSEWTALAQKQTGDDSCLRPCFDSPQPNGLTEFIKMLIHIRKNTDALCYGDYKNIVITNRQLVFLRSFENQKILIMLNADNSDYKIKLDQSFSNAVNLFTNQKIELFPEFSLPAYSVCYFKIISEN